MVLTIDADSFPSQPIRTSLKGPMRTFEIKFKTSLYKYIPEFFELLELMALLSIRYRRSLAPSKSLSSST